MAALKQWSDAFEHEERVRVSNKLFASSPPHNQRELDALRSKIEAEEFSPAWADYPAAVQVFFRRITYPEIPQPVMDELERLITKNQGKAPTRLQGSNAFRKFMAQFKPAQELPKGRRPFELARFYEAREAWLSAVAGDSFDAYKGMLRGAVGAMKSGKTRKSSTSAESEPPTPTEFRILGMTREELNICANGRVGKRDEIAITARDLLAPVFEVAGVSRGAFGDYLRGIKGGRTRAERSKAQGFGRNQVK